MVSRKYAYLPLLLGLFLKPAQAGNKTSAGLTLLEAKGARAAALGESFSAVADDVSSLGYNPASLTTLKSGQASFLFQRGNIDDAYGQFLMGKPSQNGGWGFGFAYYNSGTDRLYDGESAARNVVLEKDFLTSLGYAHDFKLASFGITGKYLTSTLAERESASAAAFDAGIYKAMNSHFNLGIALQNVGSKLQYISEKESLPQQGRIGFSSLVIPGAFQTSLMSDAVYSFDRKDVSPSVGIETIMGPLALRAGYKGGSDLENFSVGTGLHINRFSFDYSLGLVDKLSSRHRINVSMYFGNNLSLADQKIVSKPAQQESVTATPWKFVSSETTTPTFRRSMGGMTYEVKAGDTLQKIARQMYGDPNEWKTIYRANQHLMSSSNFRVGQKITLP
jgi:hypothetical protein